MPSIHLHVLSGSRAGTVYSPDFSQIRLGRAEACELTLDDAHISGEHLRLVEGIDEVFVEDLGSTNGSYRVRAGERLAIHEAPRRRALLSSGDLLEVGGAGEEDTQVRVELGPDPEPGQVVTVKPISELGTTSSAERNRQALKALTEAQAAVSARGDLNEVLNAVGDAALAIVPRATHATLVLRDQRDDEDDLSGYVPVVTRVRGEAASGPIPVARSVFRKVVRERAAVLAADAPSESFASESVLGANIMSTIGVPLWRGEEILGVLQVDNRAAPVLFDNVDLDALGVLAAIGSLAIANARLIRRLRAAEERLARENDFLKGQERTRRGGGQHIIGDSSAMKQLLGQLQKVVDTRVTVLVEGETGVGKELIASAVHYQSRRHRQMFVAQNCAALPENLLESELFGHKRGSFTGATEEKKGLFELADGGTLFLDEVTELPLALQAKLLRALQEGEIRPLGATSSKHVDVRIVAACNRNLEEEVKEGRFREDLYYRLKVFPLKVPPLRERRQDIPLLAHFFLEKYQKEIGRQVEGFSQGVQELLQAYDWPGNVRELENEIQRLVIQVDDGAFITSELVSPRVRKIEKMAEQAGVTRGALKEMVEQVEKYFIVECLREHGNNKTSAARSLGITREGLHKKLRQLKIG